MELFNEIFSRNYIEVTKLLNKIAENNGIKKTDLNLENTTITCKKLTDDIMLIKKSDNGCVSVRGHQPKLRQPLTRLELSWLKSVCADEKAGLFLNNDEIKSLARCSKTSNRCTEKATSAILTLSSPTNRTPTTPTAKSSANCSRQSNGAIYAISRSITAAQQKPPGCSRVTCSTRCSTGASR